MTYIPIFFQVFEPCPIFRWALYVWHCFDARHRFPSYETYFNLEYLRVDVYLDGCIYVWTRLKFCDCAGTTNSRVGRAPADTNLCLGVQQPGGLYLQSYQYKRTSTRPTCSIIIPFVIHTFSVQNIVIRELYNSNYVISPND